MRLTVFILLVMVSCCLGHKGRSQDRYRYSKNYRFRRPTIFPNPFTSTMMPRTTTTTLPPPSRPIDSRDDIDSARIGVRIPPRECVISYSDFVTHVADMDYISPYGIDNDYPISELISFKWAVKWKLINDTHIDRLGSYWDDTTKMCGFLDSTFKRIDETKAIFGPATGATGAFVTSTRKDYILSFDVQNHVMQYVCYSGVDESRCKDAEIFLLVKEQRPNQPGSDGKVTGEICLDDIDWRLIEETFKNCLGQQFVDDTDPQIMWLWENDGEATEECAKPGTPAFRSSLK
ncbi:uncharacterized protein LOC128555692 [Mercenaria mercenaria]|uniref:uncharacterized protein LOC128555692 n=1 Tax=Mercenaria mercenaria TaxID=6596 RepID=UPI00234EC92A|nr:uncharacterized protein LOC128555692 [Mercenaria mercenaria]